MLMNGEESSRSHLELPGSQVEFVQLYVLDEVASVTRPVKELKGFKKMALNPGESRQFQFTLTAEQLKFYDRDMKWTIEPGTFNVYVGPSSAEGSESRFEYQSR
jgi:beta-glucosidase